MYTQQSKPAFCFKHWSRQGFATFASLHKVVKIGVVTFTCSLVQVKYQAVFAQADSTEASVTDVPLQEVEVSAKQPMRWSELTHSVSVAGQKEIAASPVQSIDDMLETMPGVDIRQRGSDGVQSDISLNGGSFDQVLILLNGVNITDPQTGHYNLNIPIELSQIQRIEILRGSGARTLGSNAFCGAINFITDQPLQQNGLKGQAEIATGYWGFFKTAASIAYQKDAWQLDAGLSRNTSDGYTANTDYDILNSHIQSSWHNASAGHFLLQLGYQQKAFGANSFYSFKYPNQFDATKTLFSSFSWNKTVENTDWQIQVYERQHHDRFELFRDMENAPSWYTTHNYHLTNVNGGHFSHTFTTEHQKRLIGADIRHEQIVSNVLGEPLTVPQTDPLDKEALFTYGKQRTTYSLFYDQTFYFGKYLLSAGFSENYTNHTGFYWHGGIDGACQFTDVLKSWISLNRSVRLPSFTDLYYKSAIQSSDPNLKPETAITFEEGISLTDNKLDVSLSGFYRLGRHIIDWVKMPDSTKWESKNLTNVKALGFNTYAAYTFNHRWLQSVRADYAFQYLDKKAEGYDSKYALDYLKHKIDLKLALLLFGNKRTGLLSAVLNTSFYDRSGTYSDAVTGSLKTYDPYCLCGTRLMWSRKKIQLYLDMNNLFNTTYADFGGLEQPGFNLKSGIRYTF